MALATLCAPWRRCSSCVMRGTWVSRWAKTRQKRVSGQKSGVSRVHSRQLTVDTLKSKIQNLKSKIQNREPRVPTRNHGEVQVNTQVVGFKKIKFHTNENVGSGELTLPEQEMHTTACWLTLPYELLETLPYNSVDRQDGVNGLGNALRAMATLLVMCDARDLGVAVGENPPGRSQKSGVRSQQSPQSTVDSRQTQIQDPKSKIQSQEARTPKPESRTPIFEPNIYLYDKYPGGVGFSEPLYRMNETLLANTFRLVANCPCQAGCPSCVGPSGEVGEKGKEVALAILRAVSVVRG